MWQEIPITEYFEIYKRHEQYLKVFATITDPEGVHGSPLVMTEWGFHGDTHPILRWERRPETRYSEQEIKTFKREEHDEHD